ncbi:hypothetical protein MYU51_013991 [Penicillium brevicompactum]|uniref:uncharacterized protein n=1 Tax=Penicillium brevicompactum TaxID=5074 RepID=UPI00253F7634|nr:uncharacterized protein N7506_011756 [Penicillium brevicompactum]KAJ5319052.1 hypothetical protein N7506_011756 [Penicillium brevicompactum]
MSDDEEYYEYEEDFMYEDLVPDMVDDLAASSYYEAALYEDPAYDVEDYFSDWDYYSDDHYDDDPTAETSAERKKRTEHAAAAKRRTKGPSRKTTTVPTKSPLFPDTATFQGVLWKSPALDRDEDVAILYEPDSGEKVALLANWREVFKSSQPALDKSKLKRRRAESESIPDEEADNEMSDYEESVVSEEMSDGDSLASAEDTGDASNTTPDPEPDARVYKLASPPKVVIPMISMVSADTEKSPAKSPAKTPVKTPVKGAKRGRKRKAAVQEETPWENSEPRSKRVESRKGGGERADSSAPVRRSARQKK